MTSLKRQRTGWYLYDWANSAFSTSVVTVFLGPYLTNIASEQAADGLISPLGIPMHPGSWFSYCVAASVILQVVVLPLLGAIVDRTDHKRLFLMGLATLGSVATMLLGTIEAGNESYVLGGLFFVFANLSFGASIVVANAFLNNVATDSERDAVSSRGWALGYLGGGLLLLVHLLWFTSAKDAGEPTAPVVQGVFVTTGVWWLLFTIVSVVLLRNAESAVVKNARIGIWSGFQQIAHTLRLIRSSPRTMNFLVAYFLYNEAIQTVIAMASVYGAEELGLGLDVLTQAILMVQFVAIAGALAFARLSANVGTHTAILVGLIAWLAVIVAACTVVSTATHFFVLAGVIAIVMGGTQALSRSYFSTMIPTGKEAEYFALYEIGDKGTSWIGPLTFGLALTLTHSYRYAVLSLAVFLVGGIVMMLRMRRTGKTEA